MRVGYLTYGLDRSPGGIGRYAVELLKALAALPGAPELVLLTTEREDPPGLWGRFEHHALRGCRRLPALMTYGNLALSAAVRRLRLDLVHDPNGIAPFLGPQGGAGRIVTLHDAFPYVHPETHNRLDNWRYRTMLPAAARRADGVITVSDCSRRDLAAHLGLDPASISVISSAVSGQMAPVAPGAARQETLARYGIAWPYLLYVGGINGRKNIARLFEAFALVRAARPAMRLVVVGQRQWRTGAIDAAYQALGPDPGVIFTGYVADGDLPALYSAAELFVFPSLYEGFGFPPLEAMSCGTPVVTAGTSSLPEVVGDAALTVDPYDVQAIAAAVLRLLAEDELRATLRRRGSARAALFSWERVARQTLALYKRVTAANAHGMQATQRSG